VVGAVFGNDTGMAGGTMSMRNTRVLLFCAAAILSACNKDTETPAASKATPQAAAAKAPLAVKKGPTSTELTAGMVEAASPGKSSSPVQLKFDLVEKPKVGQPLDINLALITHVDAGTAVIQVTGGDGLTLPAGANQFDVPAAEADEVIRQAVTVTPTAEGLLIVGVNVSLKHDEITDLKAFSIPIIAGR
jgi:hypothetical protein